jgi:hypothetical protein
VTTADDLRTYIEERLITPRHDCRIWANACDRGYGRIYLDGSAQRVHRVMWELKHGPIPDGLTIDHLCRVRNCVNTEHMELVTAAENGKRAKQFRRAANQTLSRLCRNDHEYTPENTVIDYRGRRCCIACLADRRRRQASRKAERRRMAA